MPPKVAAERPCGLSDIEMTVVLHAVKLEFQAGNMNPNGVALADMAGHAVPNSALKIWTNAKANIIKEIGGTTANAINKGSSTSTPKSAGMKRGKKTAAACDDSLSDLSEPAPKRSKTKTDSKNVKVEEKDQDMDMMEGGQEEIEA